MTTLLDQIINCSTNPQTSININHAINYDPNPIFPNLKPSSQNPNPLCPVHHLDGFEISQSDASLIQSSSNFFNNLKRKLKDPNSINPKSFNDMLCSFLEKIGVLKFGGSVNSKLKRRDGVAYICELIENFGSLVGRDIMGLVIEGCVLLENWDLLGCLIVNRVVDYGIWSDLLFNLVGKRRSELICLCLRHFSDVKSLDLCNILRYFLVPSKEACLTMGSVRKEWENEAIKAIDIVRDKRVDGEVFELAKEASVLLMVAYDGFLLNELCLHFVLSSSNVDDVVFSSAISKLNVEEMLGLIRYLSKLLSKYERFPQAGPCPKAVATLGLEMCQWVPSIEDVVKCLGLVVDEHFSLLALHSEFHEQLKEIEEVVRSLVFEGKSSCSIANLIEILKPEVGVE